MTRLSILLTAYCEGEVMTFKKLIAGKMEYEISPELQPFEQPFEQAQRENEIMAQIFMGTDASTSPVMMEYTVNDNLIRLYQSGILADKYYCIVSYMGQGRDFRIEFFDGEDEQIIDIRTVPN